jgi:hypothetical protein
VAGDVALSVSFRSGPQRKEADAVITGAYICLALILELQNRHFGLGLDVERICRNVEYAWPGSSRLEQPMR